MFESEAKGKPEVKERGQNVRGFIFVLLLLLCSLPLKLVSRNLARKPRNDCIGSIPPPPPLENRNTYPEIYPESRATIVPFLSLSWCFEPSQPLGIK